MSKPDIFEQLRGMGLLDYGKVIDGEMLRHMAGIEYPETGTKAEFDAPALEELALVDYIRNRLLDEGKYIKVQRDDYRILTPFENASQINAYMSSADKKLRRAIKLSKNTPSVTGEKCQNKARILMKRESIRKKRDSIMNAS